MKTLKSSKSDLSAQADLRKLNPVVPRGMTLLVTLLVVAVLVSASTAIYAIAYRQVVFSSSARESGKSFFAADTGLECAMYWDLKKNVFSEGGASLTTECDSVDVEWTLNPNDGGDDPFYEANIDFSNGTCAYVTLTQTRDETRVESRGYNLPCSSTSDRKLERALRATYQ
jgi:hypothetical protein